MNARKGDEQWKEIIFKFIPVMAPGILHLRVVFLVFLKRFTGPLKVLNVFNFAQRAE